MSRVIFQNEILPDTNDVADLYCYITPPDALGPRQSWYLELNHTIQTHDKATGLRTNYRSIGIEIHNLHFHEPDWRMFSNFEIRADAAWHDRHEYIDHYGGLVRTSIAVREFRCRYTEDQKMIDPAYENWEGENFTLRFGRRDGYEFPLELDAWVFASEGYARTKPEPDDEAFRFPDTPPNLRVITSAFFLGGQTEVPRCGMDPLPTARTLIKQATGVEDPVRMGLEWPPRYSPDGKTHTRVPGWRATVRFRVPASGDYRCDGIAPPVA